MNSKDPSVVLTYWFAISSAEIGRGVQLLPVAAAAATATPDGWAGTAPDAPPKRSIVKSVMKIATIGTRSGVLLWWCISHPSFFVDDLDTDVKVLLSSQAGNQELT